MVWTFTTPAAIRTSVFVHFSQRCGISEATESWKVPGRKSLVPGGLPYKGGFSNTRIRQFQMSYTYIYIYRYMYMFLYMWPYKWPHWNRKTFACNPEGTGKRKLLSCQIQMRHQMPKSLNSWRSTGRDKKKG